MSDLKKYTDKNVYDAAIERLEYIFTEFEQVYFSVSFGKDSSIMMQLALETAKKLNKLPLNVLFIDFEAQYQNTIQHAKELILRPEVNAFWVCLPFNLRNASSVYQPFWQCWNPDEKDKWIRSLPSHDCVISDESYFPFFYRGMEFEEFIIEFGKWFAVDKLTACGVGIRTDESLNRFRTIASNSKIKYKDKRWTTQIGIENLYNFYPIYDWRTEDIWTATGKDNLNYNKIYDFMYLSGLSIHEARLCQPYGDDQRRGLDLFHRCEPETWFKVVNRVSGANFGSIYSKSTLMGFRKMKKPKGHTWKSYSEFLMSTLPKYEQEWYKTKFKVFFKFWGEHLGVPFDKVPDEADPDLEAAKALPSWRRIAKVLLINDKICKTLSFGQTKHQWKKYNEYRELYGE